MKKSGLTGETPWLAELKKRWFIISLLLVIIMAKVYPYLGSKEGNFFLIVKAVV